MPPQTKQELDQDVVRLAQAIREVESGGDYAARGKSREFGAYQYTPDTWNARASKYLGRSVPLEQASKEEQNEVQYKWMKEKKDAGYNIGQIASMHNAGEGRPNAYQEGMTGTNSYGVQYDVPGYAKKVAEAYQAKKAQGGYNPTPFSSGSVGLLNTSGISLGPEEKKEGIVDKLSGRVRDIGDTFNQPNLARGLLRSAGAVAGGIGDVVSSTLSAVTPDFIEKPVTEAVGNTVAAIPGVKQAAEAYSKLDPEIQKDLGAIGNIATVVPALKGAGMAVSGAKGLVKGGMQGAAEKAIMKELTDVAERTVGGRNALMKGADKGVDPVRVMVTNRFIPTVENVGGKPRYKTNDVFDDIAESLAKDEELLQQGLAKSSPAPKMFDVGVPAAQLGRVQLKDLYDEAIGGIQKEFKYGGNLDRAEAEVKRIFTNYHRALGPDISLQDLNKMKRALRETVNFNSPKLDSDVTYHLSRIFMKKIETEASRAGMKDVAAINKTMQEKILAQQMLKNIEGKEAKAGGFTKLLREGIEGGAMISGEGIGNVMGMPFAGTLFGKSLGEMAGGLIPRGQVGGTVGGLLKR